MDRRRKTLDKHNYYIAWRYLCKDRLMGGIWIRCKRHAHRSKRRSPYMGRGDIRQCISFKTHRYLCYYLRRGKGYKLCHDHWRRKPWRLWDDFNRHNKLYLRPCHRPYALSRLQRHNGLWWIYRVWGRAGWRRPGNDPAVGAWREILTGLSKPHRYERRRSKWHIRDQCVKPCFWRWYIR